VGLFSLAVSGAAAAPAEDDYALFRMTNGAVIEMKSMTRGDTVRLLTNPEITTEGSEKVPLAPAKPVWAPVLDNSYETPLGTTFVIRDSKIVSVTDRVGTNVTDLR
jgi:hypothetical protein